MRFTVIIFNVENIALATQINPKLLQNLRIEF